MKIVNKNPTIMVSKLTDTNPQTGKNNESSQRLYWQWIHTT
ncbi:MAG: hypothetical protein AB7U45_15995 [Desulfamplus sp.]